MNEELKNKIKGFVRGEVFDDLETLKKYSHDASLFEVMPKLVIWPMDAADIGKVVAFVAENKNEHKELSVTVRAAGSCMSGGSLNESIILDVSKHLNKFSVDAPNLVATVEPGVFYRDFEVETLKHDLILPCYTASKNLCALGGMIGNNAAGEKTLQYGKMENYVEELKIILRDGKEYHIKPVQRTEALKISHEQDARGDAYEQLLRLIEDNRKIINEEKPNVSKNSAGYYIWNVERNGFIDLTRLIVGSQGTLGIVTEAKIRLVPTKKFSNLLVIFLKDLNRLGDIVNKILEHKPESLESYDDATIHLAIKFLPEMLQTMKIKNFLKLAVGFLPEVKMILTGGFPKLILLVEFTGNSAEEVSDKIDKLEKDIESFKLKVRKSGSMEEAEKYWTIRRESFSLLRKHIKGKRTAPFIDDVCVKPEFLPEFLPQLQKILDDHKIVSTIAGHAGNGNFHVIPLMNMKDEKERAKITIVSNKVYDLVARYKGTITAEHNDGIVRTPYLGKIFSPKMLDIFKDIKKSFDPYNIFNPGKKVGGNIMYLESHLARE